MPQSHTHALVLTTMIYYRYIYTAVIKCTAGTLEQDGGWGWGVVRKTNQPRKQEQKNKTKTSFSTDWGSFSSQRRLQYFAMLLKLENKRPAEFLAFIRPVEHWSFPSILLSGNASFSLRLILWKYSYALGQQPSFRQIAYASPLRMRGVLVMVSTKTTTKVTLKRKKEKRKKGDIKPTARSVAKHLLRIFFFF